MSKKKRNAMTPFANESEVLIFDDLNVENRLDRITLSGHLDLTRDQVGLQQARQLQALLGQIVAALESDDLPERLPPPQVEEIDNPFK